MQISTCWISNNKATITLIFLLAASKPVKRLNVPRPLAAKHRPQSMLNKYNTQPVQRGTIPKRPGMKRPFIYGKIMSGNKP